MRRRMAGVGQADPPGLSRSPVVHPNDGTGRFRLGSTFGRAEWSTRHLAVADLNGDSFQDVVLANRNGAGSGVSYICFGVPGGGLDGECVWFAPGSATPITPVDLNQDGALDLIVPHRDGGQGFIYLNDGHGGFEDRRPFGPPVDLTGYPMVYWRVASDVYRRRRTCQRPAFRRMTMRYSP